MSLLEGYRVMLATSQGQYFVNLKIDPPPSRRRPSGNVVLPLTQPMRARILDD